MLSRLRHLFIDSWFGRILVALIFIVFVGWGVSDIFMNVWNNGLNGDPNVVAKVGDRKISVMELDNLSQKQIYQEAMKEGYSDISQIPPIVKNMTINQTLQQLILQNILINNAHSLGLNVPDTVIRDTIWNIPEYQTDGKFDREKFNLQLKAANISEKYFLSMVRDQISIQNMIDPIVSGVKVSDSFVQPYYQFLNQTRKLSFVSVPYSHFHSGETPKEEILKRYYDNHLWEFKIPEYRRVKIVILSPDTIAKSLEIDDKSLHQAYEYKKKQFVHSEARSFQVLTFNQQNQAQTASVYWRHQNNWEKIQEYAHNNQGTALEMTDLEKTATPLPELGNEVFNANPETVTEPFKTTLGWSVVKVTRILPSKIVSFEQAKSQLKAEIANEQAKQELGSRVSKLQNILAEGSSLDKITSDIGADAVEGTINEQGLTLNGEQAPIPASGKFRQNMLTKIFSTAKNTYPSVIDGGNNSYYAFLIEDILPAHEEPYDKAKNKVIKAWQNADIYHQANIAATDIYKAVFVQKKKLEEVKSGFPLQLSQGFTRQKPAQNLSPVLQNAAFSMKLGDVTMIESNDGFVVASLNLIETPQSKNDQDNYQILKDKLVQSLQNDIEASYAISLEQSSKPTINKKALDALIDQLSH